MPTLKYKDPGDGQWKLLAPSIAEAEVHVGPDAPTGNEELWYDTDAMPTAALPNAFASKAALLGGWTAPPAGATAYLSDNKIPVVFNGTEWQRMAPYKKVQRFAGHVSTAGAAMNYWPLVVNGGPANLTVDKFAAGSKLVITVQWSAYVTGAGGVVDWYLRVTGVDTLLVRSYFNALATHVPWSATVELTPAAGSIATQFLVWPGAGVTINCDASDYFHLIVEEVNPT